MPVDPNSLKTQLVSQGGGGNKRARRQMAGYANNRARQNKGSRFIYSKNTLVYNCKKKNQWPIKPPRNHAPRKRRKASSCPWPEINASRTRVGILAWAPPDDLLRLATVSRTPILSLGETATLPKKSRNPLDRWQVAVVYPRAGVVQPIISGGGAVMRRSII